MKMRKITKRLLKVRRKSKRSQDRKHEEEIRSLKGLIVALQVKLADLESDLGRTQRLLWQERGGDHWLLIIEAEQNTVFHFEGDAARTLAMAALANNIMPRKVVTVAKVHQSSGNYKDAGKVIIGGEINNGALSPGTHALLPSKMLQITEGDIKEIG